MPAETPVGSVDQSAELEDKLRVGLCLPAHIPKFTSCQILLDHLPDHVKTSTAAADNHLFLPLPNLKLFCYKSALVYKRDSSPWEPVRVLRQAKKLVLKRGLAVVNMQVSG